MSERWEWSSRRLQFGRAAPTTDVDTGRFSDELDDVGDFDADFVAGVGKRPFRPHAGADQHVHPELAGPRQPGAADLRGDIGFLDRQPTAATGAIRPLGDVVDVGERQAGNRIQDEPGCFVNVLALVQSTRVVIGDCLVDRLGQDELALFDQIRYQLDDLE
jgi:hypothetical protein